MPLIGNPVLLPDSGRCAPQAAGRQACCEAGSSKGGTAELVYTAISCFFVDERSEPNLNLPSLHQGRAVVRLPAKPMQAGTNWQPALSGIPLRHRQLSAMRAHMS